MHFTLAVSPLLPADILSAAEADIEVAANRPATIIAMAAPLSLLVFMEHSFQVVRRPLAARVRNVGPDTRVRSRCRQMPFSTGGPGATVPGRPGFVPDRPAMHRRRRTGRRARKHGRTAMATSRGALASSLHLFLLRTRSHASVTRRQGIAPARTTSSHRMAGSARGARGVQ